MNDAMAAAFRRAGRFLDDHWAVRFYLVPIAFMASVLFLLTVLDPTVAPVAGLQLVAVFLALALSVAAAGVALELAVRLVARRRARD